MIKLLVVEDDSTLLYIVQSGLQEIIGGYEVFRATNGAEGLKAWKEHHPDIIMSDVDMPVMDGYEMVARIPETEDDYFASHSLDVFMSKIRKYLEDEPSVEIKTVRGGGFMMLLDCI